MIGRLIRWTLFAVLSTIIFSVAIVAMTLVLVAGMAIGLAAWLVRA